MSTELKYTNEKFICPHCSTLAKQDWSSGIRLSKIVTNIYHQKFLDYRSKIQDYEQAAINKFLSSTQAQLPKDINLYFPLSLSISKCQSCNNAALWINEEIVYPRNIPVDSPNSDMNQDIQDLYNEAATIIFDSSKGAAALLRLALQKLLIQLGQDGKNINQNIKSLVSDGLNPKMQKALDIVRVVGNNAVHPGEINLDDNKDIAIKLFKIINLIAEDMITKPKEMDSLYDEIIPDETKGHIQERDGK